ncbi:MAG TPA: DUF1361 domain-containing protein [Candidatus Saccharimonadales bacterium]|nr:DUF1361 domain-containing protein [Candidatus Saccharimonadales bacterium]
MHLILFNIQWMSFNVFLAVIAVIFGWLMVKTPSKFLKIFYGSIWFVFLPNTIYLLTDIGHFFVAWPRVPLSDKGIFISEYAILMIIGAISFILGLYPIEQFFRKTKNKRKQIKKDIFIYGTNFLIGFGLVLGRIERVNSWDVLTNTSAVVYKSLHTITSIQLSLLVIFFGLLSNLVYFTLRDFIVNTLFTRPFSSTK